MHEDLSQHLKALVEAAKWLTFVREQARKTCLLLYTLRLTFEVVQHQEGYEVRGMLPIALLIAPSFMPHR